MSIVFAILRVAWPFILFGIVAWWADFGWCNGACHKEKTRADAAEKIVAEAKARADAADARWTAQVRKTEGDALRQLEVNHANTAALQDRARHLPAGATVRFSADAAGLFIDVARAANGGQATPAQPEARAPPVPDAAQTVEYDQREFAAWEVNAGAAYKDATDLFHETRDALLTCLKGTP